MLLVAPNPAGVSVALMKSPDGKLATIAVSRVKEFFEAGYRPVTAGDLVDEESSLQQAAQSLQARFEQSNKVV